MISQICYSLPVMPALTCLVPFLLRYDSPLKSITILSTVSSPNAKRFSDVIRDDVQSKFDTVFDESRRSLHRRIRDDESVSARVARHE